VGTLRRALATIETTRINRRKGIYTLASDKCSTDERRRLEASARVVLDTCDGSLADCMARHSGRVAALPRFEPTLPRTAQAATGDSAILTELVAYLSGAPLEADEHDRYAEYSASTADDTLLDHCRRALHFHNDGSILGSASARECRIDSIAQSWAVLSSVADAERARLAMQAAQAQLVDEKNRLILLLTPPFDHTIHDPGYIRAYPPGVRENGGQYTHAAAWLGFAHAALGDGEGAHGIFQLLNPILRSQTREEVDRYRLEPYVLAGDVYGSSP